MTKHKPIGILDPKFRYEVKVTLVDKKTGKESTYSKHYVDEEKAKQAWVGAI